MAFALSPRSLGRLAGVHPDLIRVVQRAIELTAVDFGITEGVRDLLTQRRYVAEGKSRTMNSRHLTGHAVDVVAMVGGQVSWTFSHYVAIADAFKQASRELDIPIAWGGDWESFRDGPHFELDRKAYPAPVTA